MAVCQSKVGGRSLATFLPSLSSVFFDSCQLILRLKTPRHFDLNAQAFCFKYPNVFYDGMFCFIRRRIIFFRRGIWKFRRWQECQHGCRGSATRYLLYYSLLAFGGRSARSLGRNLGISRNLHLNILLFVKMNLINCEVPWFDDIGLIAWIFACFFLKIVWSYLNSMINLLHLFNI